MAIKWNIYNYSNMITNSWNGHDIRVVFVPELNDWYFVLKDVCDVLQLRTDNTSKRVMPYNICKVHIQQIADHYSIGVSSGRNGVRHGQIMTCVNEAGVYQAVYNSRSIEARQFQDWLNRIIISIRQSVGLKPWEVMQMLDTDVQQRFLSEPEPQKRFIENLHDIRYNPVSGQYYVEHMDGNGDPCLDIIDPTTGEIIE